jgi:hypothetical protein
MPQRAGRSPEIILRLPVRQSRTAHRAAEPQNLTHRDSGSAFYTNAFSLYYIAWIPMCLIAIWNGSKRRII